MKNCGIQCVFQYTLFSLFFIAISIIIKKNVSFFMLIRYLCTIKARSFDTMQSKAE